MSDSLVVVWIKSLATAAQCSFCSGSRSCGMSFARTPFMPWSWIKILDTAVFGIPRSAASSHTVSHDICWLQPIHIQLLRCSAHCRPSRTWIIFNYSWPSLKDLCHIFICAALIASSPKALWIIWIVSAGECSSLCKIWRRFIALLALIHFECDGHTVHMLTQSRLLPLTSTVKSSLFTHVHSVHSPWLPCYIYVV